MALASDQHIPLDKVLLWPFAKHSGTLLRIENGVFYHRRFKEIDFLRKFKINQLFLSLAVRIIVLFFKLVFIRFLLKLLNLFDPFLSNKRILFTNPFKLEVSKQQIFAYFSEHLRSILMDNTSFVSPPPMKGILKGVYMCFWEHFRKHNPCRVFLVLADRECRLQKWNLFHFLTAKIRENSWILQKIISDILFRWISVKERIIRFTVTMKINNEGNWRHFVIHLQIFLDIVHFRMKLLLG